MKELLEQGLGIMVIGGVAGIGIFVRLILLGYYGTLSYACKRMERTKNKTIAYIKEDLKKRAGQAFGIRNAMTYTECRLAERKVCGVRVGVWESMMQYSVVFVVLSGALVALAGALAECGDKFVLHMLFLGGVAIGSLVFVDLLTGIREKDRRIRLCIRDYIENCGNVYGGSAEAAKKARNCRKADKPKKVVSKKNGKAQEEKRRLTEELLRERRQLEARSFAEQRKKERTEECPVQQVQAEAAVAVTEMPDPVEQEEEMLRVPSINEEGPEAKAEEKPQDDSYELLFREVLAEYLA